VVHTIDDISLVSELVLGTLQVSGRPVMFGELCFLIYGVHQELSKEQEDQILGFYEDGIYPFCDPNVVRRAVWHLIDAGKVELTSDRKFVAV